MQYSLSLVALFAAGALAQTSIPDLVKAIPACAIPCIDSAAVAAGCVQGDYKCQCSNQAKIQAGALGCVVSSCTDPADVPKILSGVKALCDAVAAGAGTPSTTAVVTTTSAVATTTAAGTTTTDAAPSTTDATSAASSAASSISSKASSLSSAISSIASSIVAAPSNVTTKAPTTAAPSPTPIQANGAEKFSAGFGLLGAAIVGALAL